MTRALVPLLVALALVLPAAAVAQAPQTNAPPGNSAIDEYLETVPGAAGNMRPRPPSEGDGGSAAAGGANGGKLTPAQRARLERLGPDGKTLADAIDATAPTAPTKPVKVSERTPASSHTSAPEPETGSSSPLTEVAGAFAGSDGGSGMGLALPTILLAALLAAVTLVLARHRAGH